MSKENKNTILFYNNLMEKYNGKLLNRNGNVMHIEVYGNEYYYGVPSKKIRRKGEPNWTTNIEKVIKSNDYVD